MRTTTPRDTASFCPSCGFTSKATTAGLARHALALHSCARHKAIAASRARGAKRRAAVNRTLRPCEHPNAQHQHGTHAAYVLDRCRCHRCRAANTAYERTRHRRRGYGTWQPYVDAAPARQHVLELRAAGLGLKRVAALSGVAHGTLWKLMYGKRTADGSQRVSRQLRPETATAILAVRPHLDLLGATVPVDATGTHRRIQALVALGWSQSKLADRIGRGRSNFNSLLHTQHVYASTARAVRDLYAELQNTVPAERDHQERQAASRARNHAKARGWLAPGWWDEDTIDDPSYEPSTDDRPRHWSDVDPVVVQRACNGERVALTRAERITAVLELTDRGFNQRAIARQLHVSDRQVVRDEHGGRIAS